MTRLDRVLSVVALAVGGAVVAGCGTDDPSSDVVSVRDSAGVRIAEDGGGSPGTRTSFRSGRKARPVPRRAVVRPRMRIPLPEPHRGLSVPNSYPEVGMEDETSVA